MGGGKPMNNSNNELYHYGVKGMKWGHRKATGTIAQPNAKKRYTTAADVSAAKKQMKSAKKAFDKAYNKADFFRGAVISPSKKQREANERRWDDALDKGQKYYEAKKNYKTMKKSYKKAIKEESKKILAGESFAGKMYDVLTDAHKIQAELKINNRG